MGGPIGHGPIPSKGPILSYNLEEKLQHYKTKLPLKNSEIKTILEHNNQIEESLKTELNVEEVHIIGSYSRGTMIESVKGNDIDVMFVLNHDKHGQWLEQERGPSNCLQTIKQILEKDPKYRNMNIRIDRNVVVVSDKKHRIEVVPAFKHETMGYKIPDTYGQKWIQTDPRRFKRVMESMDKQRNGRVSEVVKIVKGWNEANGKPLKSYHIETMIYDHYKTQKINDKSLNEDVRSVFRELPWRIRNSTYDPIFTESRVDSYLSPSDKSNASIKAQHANLHLEDTVKLYNEGRNRQADKKLKQIFGKKVEM